ncbi:MAG: hypothetical protein PWP23_2846 [Candidatus Sumerlaeota bacterium]|nr:hypothetical protein [Candidatus Sumerlaeota bacterium]
MKPPPATTHFRRIAHRLRRTAWWTLCAGGGLVLASGLAYGLGYSVYVLNGRPNHYTQMERSRLVRPFVLGLMFRTTEQLIAELQVGAPASSFEVRASRVWQLPADEPGVLEHNDAVRVVYQKDTRGRATRYCLVAQGMDPTLAGQAITRLVTYLGQPDAKAGRVGGELGPDEVLVWTPPNGTIAVEFRPEADGSITMIVNASSSIDPRFVHSRETGGLPLWHRHAASIREQLAAPAPAKGTQRN